jgi:hypothetical protein
MLNHSRGTCFPHPRSKKGYESMTPDNSPLATQSGAEADDRLSAEAIALLRASGHRPLWSLSCDVRGDMVVLSGVLPTFYLKQVAQALLLRLESVQGVQNRVEVR